MTFETFQAENGTDIVLQDADNKLIETVCTGTCATGSTSQSVINATCKELETGPEWVDKDEQILTEETVNTMWKDECQTCEDIKDKDPGSLFKWNCTLEVLITVSQNLFFKLSLAPVCHGFVLTKGFCRFPVSRHFRSFCAPCQ